MPTSTIPRRPVALPLRPQNIPAELTNRAQWLVWSYDWIEREGHSGKWDKPPIDAKTNASGSSINQRTWSTFEEAVTAREIHGHDGIGFAVSPPIFVVDIDQCFENGRVTLMARAIVDRTRGYLYWERSPSDKGLRGIGIGSFPQHRKKNPQTGFEIYCTGRYVTITGHVFDRCDSIGPDSTAIITEIHREQFGEAPSGRPRPQQNDIPPADDMDIIERCRRFKNGPKFERLMQGSTAEHGGDDSSADAALVEMILFANGGDIEQAVRIASNSMLWRPKWETRRGGTDYIHYTAERILEKMTGFYEPGYGQAAIKENWRKATGEDCEDATGIRLADFGSYLPERKYIYLPTGKMWDPAGIDRAFPPIDRIKQSRLIDAGCPIHDMTWAPGRPQIIEDAFLDHGGWITKAGARTFNHYRSPSAASGDPRQAGPWHDLLERVYPEDAWHIVSWFAHRVQRPEEKLNHALVLGGTQGIGKDSILEPVRDAVGPQNFGDVSPEMLVGRFNAFLKNVILRVSELRDLGDRDRYGFYEHSKTLISAPPATVLIDEKHIRAYLVPNLVGVVFTTNHRTDGLFLPEDDRRHYVAWSDALPADFEPGFWTEFYNWLETGGRQHVAAYLAAVDLSGFDAKAPPPKTTAFWNIVAASRAPEDAQLTDAIEKLGNPKALTIADVAAAVAYDDYEFKSWLTDRRNRRQLPHRFEACGYVAVHSPSANDGRFVVGGVRQTVYAKRELSSHDRIAAASERAARP